MTVFLAILFACSVVAMAFIIVRKVPYVLATPRQVIDDYFTQSSSRFYVRMLRVRSWFRRGGYWDQLLALSVRALKTFTESLRRLEFLSSSLMKAASQKSAERKMQALEEADTRYWEELKVPQAPAEISQAEPKMEEGRGEEVSLKIDVAAAGKDMVRKKRGTKDAERLV